MNKIIIPVLASVLILGTFAAPAYAVTLSIDKGSSNLDNGKLKVKVDIFDFTETSLDNFQVIVALQNTVTGERAIDFGQFDANGKIKNDIETPVGGNPVIFIEKAKLDLAKGEMKIDTEFFNFSPASEEDLRIIVVLRNTSNGEQGINFAVLSEL